MDNTPTIETKRLILRKFKVDDVEALYKILSDKEVNTFLPMFALKNIEEAKEYLRENYLEQYKKPSSYHYAICLKGDNVPIGYINISDDDSNDFGYGLRKEFWHKGIVTEACMGVIERIKDSGLHYITATHDVNNPRSGEVMKKLGMTYKYSYEEKWKPKDILVTFRLYQLNFDGKKDSVYMKYWNKYSNHFIEENI